MGTLPWYPLPYNFFSPFHLFEVKPKAATVSFPNPHTTNGAGSKGSKLDFRKPPSWSNTKQRDTLFSNSEDQTVLSGSPVHSPWYYGIMVNSDPSNLRNVIPLQPFSALSNHSSSRSPGREAGNGFCPELTSAEILFGSTPSHSVFPRNKEGTSEKAWEGEAVDGSTGTSLEEQ